MSLPTELQTWVCCPFCGEIDDLVRLRPLKRTKFNGSFVNHESPIKCGYCKKTFYSEKGTRRENMGLDYGIGQTDW